MEYCYLKQEECILFIFCFKYMCNSKFGINVQEMPFSRPKSRIMF